MHHQKATMEIILVAHILNQLEPCTGIAVNDAPVQVHIYPLYTHRAYVVASRDAPIAVKLYLRLETAIIEADSGKDFVTLYVVLGPVNSFILSFDDSDQCTDWYCTVYHVVLA